MEKFNTIQLSNITENWWIQIFLLTMERILWSSALSLVKTPSQHLAKATPRAWMYIQRVHNKMQNSGYSQKQKGQIRPKTHHSWHSSVKNNNNQKQIY